MPLKQSQILAKTRAFVAAKLGTDSTGHDWAHVQRVAKIALKLSGSEPKADKALVELGALLHDIADWKFNHGDEEAGPRVAAAFLKKIKAGPGITAQVLAIIRETTYKGAGVKTKPSSLEGQLVQDADRLDAMGAVGIARAFAYGGAKGRPLYDPKVPPVLHQSFSQYKKSKSHTINHFYEKLLLLKKRMNTPAGGKMAAARHAFMQGYLKQFYLEWEGKA